ncbi:MAG: hypothetical protein WA230_08675 [Xanthobacteraceae bacterium]
MVKNILTGADCTRLHDGFGGGTDGVVAENAVVTRVDQVVSRMRAQETAIRIKQRRSVNGGRSDKGIRNLNCLLGSTAIRSLDFLA